MYKTYLIKHVLNLGKKPFLKQFSKMDIYQYPMKFIDEASMRVIGCSHIDGTHAFSVRESP